VLQALSLLVCNREMPGPIFWAGDTATVTKLLFVFLSQCRQILVTVPYGARPCPSR